MLGGYSMVGLYIDIALAVVIFLILFVAIAIRKKAQQKADELEKRLILLEEQQAAMFASLEEKVSALKEMLFEKTNPLTTKLNELSKKLNAILEKNETIRSEIDGKVNPLKASIVESTNKMKSSHDIMMKIVQKGGNEIERMAKDIDAFALEIKNMKDFIRERTIDLEL